MGKKMGRDRLFADLGKFADALGIVLADAVDVAVRGIDYYIDVQYASTAMQKVSQRIEKDDCPEYEIAYWEQLQ